MAMISTADGGDGMSYHVMIQEHDYSCAAASLCMIVWMKKGKFLREDQARLLIEHCYAQGKGNEREKEDEEIWAIGCSEHSVVS